jgi:hypothetical protein
MAEAQLQNPINSEAIIGASQIPDTIKYLLKLILMIIMNIFCLTLEQTSLLLKTVWSPMIKP